MYKTCIAKIMLFAITGILMANLFLFCRKAWLCHDYDKSFQMRDYTRAAHFMRKLEQSYPQHTNPKQKELRNLLYCISEDKQCWYDKDVWENVYEPVFRRRWKRFQEKFSANKATEEDKKLLCNSIERMQLGGSRQARLLLQSQVLFFGLGTNSEWALEIRTKAMEVIHEIGGYHVMKEIVLIHGNKLYTRDTANSFYHIVSELYPKLEEDEKKQAFPFLLSSLNHHDPNVRWSAIDLMERIFAELPEEEKKQAFPFLRSSLNHNGPDINRAGINCMGRTYAGLSEEEKKQAFPFLLSYLNHHDPNLRWSAIGLMERIFAELPEEEKKQAFPFLLMRCSAIPWREMRYIGLSEEEKKQAFTLVLSSLKHDNPDLTYSALDLAFQASPGIKKILNRYSVPSKVYAGSPALGVRKSPSLCQSLYILSCSYRQEQKEIASNLTSKMDRSRGELSCLRQALFTHIKNVISCNIYKESFMNVRHVSL